MSQIQPFLKIPGYPQKMAHFKYQDLIQSFLRHRVTHKARVMKNFKYQDLIQSFLRHRVTHKAWAMKNFKYQYLKVEFNLFKTQGYP